MYMYTLGTCMRSRILHFNCDLYYMAISSICDFMYIHLQWNIDAHAVLCTQDQGAQSALVVAISEPGLMCSPCMGSVTKFPLLDSNDYDIYFVIFWKILCTDTNLLNHVFCNWLQYFNGNWQSMYAYSYIPDTCTSQRNEKSWSGKRA